MNGGYFPANFSGLLSSVSVAIASLNIFGGFLVTQRMLNMFRRPTDPPEYNYLMGVAAAVAALGYFGGVKAGVPVPQLTNMAYIASAVLCILSIGSLAKQSTARMGNSLGALGVSFGVMATLGMMNYPLPLLTQWAAMVLLGGTVGGTIA